MGLFAKVYSVPGSILTLLLIIQQAQDVNLICYLHEKNMDFNH